MKKFSALLLCLMLLLSATVAAFASQPVTIVGATIEEGLKSDAQGKIEEMYDGNYKSAYVYGWVHTNDWRTAVFELEQPVVLTEAKIIWGHPSWKGFDMSARTYVVYVSADGEEWSELYVGRDDDGTEGEQRTDVWLTDGWLENVKYVKVEVRESNGPYLAIAEISLSAADEPSSSAEESAAEEPSEPSQKEVSADSSAVEQPAPSTAFPWLWTVVAAVAVAAVVVIVLATKKKK
ncbi:MAG: hypothetical protein EGP89_01360 [Ruminococcaceae bacterium]|nr:hypothetical protein [Oscillospiraceae bacterium]